MHVWLLRLIAHERLLVHRVFVWQVPKRAERKASSVLSPPSGSLRVHTVRVRRIQHRTTRLASRRQRHVVTLSAIIKHDTIWYLQ